jgi:hypothetical protein
MEISKIIAEIEKLRRESSDLSIQKQRDPNDSGIFEAGRAAGLADALEIINKKILQN